jgi:hypothetical protein
MDINKFRSAFSFRWAIRKINGETPDETEIQARFRDVSEKFGRTIVEHYKDSVVILPDERENLQERELRLYVFNETQMQELIESLKP